MRKVLARLHLQVVVGLCEPRTTLAPLFPVLVTSVTTNPQDTLTISKPSLLFSKHSCLINYAIDAVNFALHFTKLLYASRWGARLNISKQL